MKNCLQILWLIILTSFISCNDEFQNTNVVLAGMYNSSYIYHEYLPPLAVKTELNITTGFYEGTDSIDLNLDGNFDLIISLRLHPNDTIYEKGGRHYYPTCRMDFKNGFEVAMKGIPYSCGHGICNHAPFIAALEYGSDVSHFPEWSESKTNQTLWSIWPDDFGFKMPGGWWSFVKSEDMYIGFRHKHNGPKNTIYYYYGWIKVNALDHQNMTFTSCAME